MNRQCECSDSLCPAHEGISVCNNKAVITLYRIDMEDNTGTLFCDECSNDAMESGLFITWEEKRGIY